MQGFSFFFAFCCLSSTSLSCHHHVMILVHHTDATDAATILTKLLLFVPTVQNAPMQLMLKLLEILSEFFKYPNIQHSLAPVVNVQEAQLLLETVRRESMPRIAEMDVEMTT